MTEPLTGTSEAPAQVAPAQPAEAPWGADFDAEKAWKLVENLRSDKERLASRPVLTSEQQYQLDEYNSLVEASKSETQRLQEAANAAQAARDQAMADVVRYKVAATHGIPAEDFDLLGSGSEEEVTARAQRLAALRAAAQVPTAPPAGRPVASLQPGAAPAAVQTQDELDYAALFGPNAR